MENETKSLGSDKQRGSAVLVAYFVMMQQECGAMCGCFRAVTGIVVLGCLRLMTMGQWSDGCDR
jgi:hypothetical protein